jgi:isoamylase
MRDYWRGEPATLGDFAARLTGSSDLYQDDRRRPSASINFITAHDGFTLRDLVSYNEKHNEANGEDNRDGESHNRSWNHGAEGETDDPEITALRARQRRNMLVTLLTSQGVPMLLHGDELGRTQGGNNNGYCQDNAVSWIDWAAADEELIAFTSAVSALRSAHPVLRRRRFPRGDALSEDGAPGLVWLRPDGQPMRPEDWEAGFARSLALFLNGRAITEPDPRGERIVDDSLLLIFNAHHEPVEFTLPAADLAPAWRVAVDTETGQAAPAEDEPALEPGATVTVVGRAAMVLVDPR